MLRASKRVIITSDRVNSFGFRSLTDGIDIGQYEKNPIFLFMHNRAFGSKKDLILPIGNVIELKREDHPEYGRVITGQPMFDDTDPFAKQLYDKFENGTLRMVSAGLLPKVWSDDEEDILPGQTGFTLAKSILQEVSLADIGANPDALSVALYNLDNELITLSQSGENAAIPKLSPNENQSEINMKLIQLNASELLVKLGLPTQATPTQVEEKISEVITLSAQQATEIQTLTAGKAESDNKVTELESKLAESEIVSLVDTAEKEGKITKGQREDFIKLAKADKETVMKMFETMPATKTAQVQLAENAKTANEKYAGKSWNDLDRSGDLVALKNDDPTLYDQLYAEKFGKKN